MNHSSSTIRKKIEGKSKHSLKHHQRFTRRKGGADNTDTRVSQIKSCNRREYTYVYPLLIYQAKYMRGGCGWTFGKIDQLQINLNQFKPLAGGSFKLLASTLAKQKAIVNIWNEDHRCCQWAFLAVGGAGSFA